MTAPAIITVAAAIRTNRNAELVARLAGLCGEYGRHAASCAEARSLPGLPAT